jgi:hypothetical protein
MNQNTTRRKRKPGRLKRRLLKMKRSDLLRRGDNLKRSKRWL